MHPLQASNDFIHSGCTAYNNGQYAKAGRMFIMALKKAREANCEGETLCMIRFNLGLYYCHQKRYKKAESCFLSALTICREQKDFESEYRVLMQLSDLYARWDKPRRSSRTYQEILSTSRIASKLSVLELDTVFSKLFKLYYTTGKYTRASQVCQEAVRWLLKKEDGTALASRWSVFQEHCDDVQRGRRNKDGTGIVLPAAVSADSNINFRPA